MKKVIYLVTFFIFILILPLFFVKNAYSQEQHYYTEYDYISPPAFCNSACENAIGAADYYIEQHGGDTSTASVTCDGSSDCYATCTNGITQQYYCNVNCTPTPTPPVCGNGVCEEGEDCTSCPQDCGACPPAATPTPTSVPACGVPCQIPADCRAAKDGCTTCTNGVCSAPTPTPTPVPACGMNCTTDADCSQIPGCTSCLPSASGVTTCQAPPTPTPVPACGVACQTPADCLGAKDGCTECINNVCKTPPACGVACQTPADCQSAKDGCTDCLNNVCAAPPTPTPTPIPFNPAACTCNGISYTGLFSGQSATITAGSKVVGQDTADAMVKSESFFLAQGAETIAKIIDKSGPIPATVTSSTPNEVDYQTQWNLTIPQIDASSTYRLWAQIDCEPKTQADNYSPNASPLVLAAQTTSHPSFFDSIVNFIKALFGVTSGTQTPSTPSASPTVTGVSTSPQEQQLKLGTTQPLQVYQKTCSFIKFKVSNGN